MGEFKSLLLRQKKIPVFLMKYWDYFDFIHFLQKLDITILKYNEQLRPQFET